MGLLAKRRGLVTLGQAGANEVVDRFAKADGALSSQLLNGSGDIVSERDRGTRSYSLVHLDVPVIAS
jgi:hypothetical protein